MNQPPVLAATTAPPADDAPCTRLHHGERRRLPDRREGGYTQKFWVHDKEGRVDPMRVYLSANHYPGSGKPGEIFVDVSKQGTPLRTLFDCLAIAVSLGLQYGVPMQEFTAAFVGTEFEPSGPVEGHATIKEAKSLVDAIFRDLEATYPPALLEEPDADAAG